MIFLHVAYTFMYDKVVLLSYVSKEEQFVYIELFKDNK